MKNRSTAAFSLVELTLAIGIAAFCLIAVFGLMPVGVQTNRNATSQTAATNIIASVIADMRATTSSTSPQYGITFGTARTLLLRWRRTVYDSVRCEFAVSREHNVSFESSGWIELCRH